MPQLPQSGPEGVRVRAGLNVTLFAGLKLVRDDDDDDDEAHAMLSFSFSSPAHPASPLCGEKSRRPSALFVTGGTLKTVGDSVEVLVCAHRRCP